MKNAKELLTEFGFAAESTDVETDKGPRIAFQPGEVARVEIPSVEGPKAFEVILSEAEERGVVIHRISQGSGVLMLLDHEIARMVELGADNAIEVCLFVGPRAPWEGNAMPLTPEGGVFGWRHTDLEQVRHAYKDVVRAVELGIRSLLVADEGLTWLIQEARRSGALPDDLVLKGSAAMGIANPIWAAILEDLGLDSVNVASNSSVATLRDIRRFCDLPIDLYIESPDGFGGFVRYPELPVLIESAAPVHLKFGLRNAAGIYPSGEHLAQLVEDSSRERVRRAAIGLALLERETTPVKLFSPDPRRAGVPRRS